MWIAITEAHLLTRISGDELASIRAAALGTAQADPMQPTIDQVTSYVRSRVAACQRNQLGTGNTIPDELLGDALALIVLEFMGRAAGLSIDPNGVRKTAAATAEERLKAAAACELAIVKPATVTTDVIGSLVPAFGKRHRNFTHGQQEG